VLGYKNGDKNYIGVSGGVEPIFATYYTRRSESFGNQFFKVFHSTIQAYIDKMNLQEAVDASNDVDDALPDFLTRTAHKINSEKRVDIQGEIQKYIDHSISSTINLSEDVNPELISDVYLKAWKKKLKGVTVYRDGSRFPILSVEGELTEFQENKGKSYTITNEIGEAIEVGGDEIMKMPDGSLTTVYHYLKNSSLAIEEVLTSTKFEEIEL
jgi:ribonucleoside-diphosphate reductase alpha chain